MTLALIPCLAVLILSLIAGVDEFPFPDCGDYLNLSNSLMKDFSFGHATIQPAWRTPGYPLLLLLFAWLGKYSFLTANLILLFGTIFFTQAIAEKWQVKNSIWLIPLLFILSPGLLTLASVPLSEIAFIFFFITAIYATISKRYCIAGLCLSYATLCRPISIMLFILFIAWLIWQQERKQVIIIFVILANLLPLLWTARNYVKYDHATYTSLSGYNLLYYKAGSYLSWKNNIPFNDMRYKLSTQVDGADVFERSSSAGKLGRKLLLENFWGFCLWAPRDMIYFLMPDITPLFERLHIISGNRGTLDILRRKGIWAAFNHYFNNNISAMIATFLYLVFYCLFFAAIGVGIIRLWLKKDYPKLIFGFLLTAYFWVLPIGNLDWRFRMPIIPLLFILAVYGINGLWLARQKMQQQRKLRQA